MNKNQKWFFPWKTNSSQHQSLHQQGLAWNWPGPALRAHLHHLTREHQRTTGQRLWCEKVIGEHRHQTKKTHETTTDAEDFGHSVFANKMHLGKNAVKHDECSQTSCQSRMIIRWSRSKPLKRCTTPWGTCGGEGCTSPVAGFLDMSCAKAQISLFHSLYFDSRLDFRDSSRPSQKVINNDYGIQPQAMPTENKKVEPSISAVLHVGTLLRLGGIPCSLAHPPSWMHYESMSTAYVVC